MTYPEGNLLARNLVRRPKFDSTAAREDWDAIYYLDSLQRTMGVSLNVEARAWAGGRYRLGTGASDLNGYIRVAVPKEALTRGLVVDTEYYCAAKSGGMDVGLVPVFNTGLATDPKGERFVYADRAKAGSWATPLPAGGTDLRKGTAIVPALPPKWYVEDARQTLGTRWYVEDAVGAMLVFAPPADTNISSTALVTVRADYHPTSLGGYFDGDTVNTSTVAYSWAEGKAPSISEARSVTTGPTEPTEPPVVEPEPEPEPPVTEPPVVEPEDPEPTDPPITEPPVVEPPVTEPEDPAVPPVIPNPEDDVPEANHPLAKRLVAYVGRRGDTEALELANAQLPIVEAFVHGYTRGRGFYADGTPEPPLQAVVISAAARLLANPDQVTWYQVGDYSERPRVLEGYTLAEIGVLHRYRKRAA